MEPKFVFEYLYLEDVSNLTPPSNKKDKEEEVERGIITVNLFSDDDDE